MGAVEGRRPSVMLLGSAVAVIAVFIGVVIARASSEPDYAMSASETQDESSAMTHTPHVEGDASGWDNSGVVDAAVSFATASQRWLYLTDDEVASEVDLIASPAAAKRLSTDVSEEMTAARDQLAAAEGPVWWIVRPLATRIDRFDGADARVSVWLVTVLSAAGVAAPQSEYLTVTLDLIWIDEGWKVDAVRDSAGPTPVSGPRDQPWDAEPFAEALNGFIRVGESGSES